ncbi:MAG: CGLD27 family protein, partial [Scytonema sp. CRU_2_7]|nr:CGLD27 family protein [Scytonema sp. CRU_2_7]
MIKSSVSNCPVPTEQQPLNEYEELKTSWLFRDCALNWREQITKMLWIWALSWVVAGPVAAASFAPHKHIAQFILCGAAGASIGVVLALVRLYLGWFYISDRLFSPTVFYEESGWYDGQTWTKPEDVLNRDRLIATYE